MYNIMYLYVFQSHAKLCLSESLEACCYLKRKEWWQREDNHTVRIFPEIFRPIWCLHAEDVI